MLHNPAMLVSDLAATIPGAAKIFTRYGIGFCCDGRRPLSTVCGERGLDIGALLSELDQLGHQDDQAAARLSLAELTQHLFTRYHQPLRESLVHIRTMLDALAGSHGAEQADLAAVRAPFMRLIDDLGVHLAKEEEILFPLVQYVGSAPAAALADLVKDHDGQRRHLADLQTATNGWQAPAGACTTWSALVLALAELARDLEAHLVLEESALFNRLT